MNGSVHTNGLWRMRAAAAVLLTLAVALRPAQASGPGVNGRVLALDDKERITGIVPGATIEFKNQAGGVAARATADQNGYYKADLPPGTYRYKVQAAGFKDEDVGRGITLKLSDGYAVYNFSLMRGKTDPKLTPPVVPPVAVGRLKGQVLEKIEGKLIGIPGAVITLRNTTGPPKPIQVVSGTASGTAAGHYGEVVLPAGAYRASVAAAGFDIFVDPNPITIAADQTTTRDFVLHRHTPPAPQDQGIRGVVKAYDRDGRIVTLPSVKLTIRGTAGASIPGSPDAQGSFSSALAAGGYQVVAEAAGYQTATVGPAYVFPGKYTVVNLALRTSARPLTFVATVRDTAKHPLPEATVLLRKPGQPAQSALRGVTGEDGTVSLKPAAPGSYEVLAYKTGYRSAGHAVTINAGADNRADLILEKDTRPPAATLTVQVRERGPSGKAVAGARVVVRKAGSVVGEGRSDAAGRFAISLPLARYTVSAEQAGYQPGSASVALTGDMSVNVFLNTRPTLTVHAMERGTGGKATPVAGALVVIRKAGQEVTRGSTDAAGTYKLNLSADQFQVEVSKAGYQTATAAADLTHGSARVDVFLGGPQDHQWTLTIKVLERYSAEKLMPVPDATVLIKRGGQSVAQGTPVAAGQYAAHVQAGSHEVAVSKAGYETATLNVTVGNQNVGRTVILRKGGQLTTARALTLTVRELGRGMTPPVAGARITIARTSGGSAGSGMSDASGQFTAHLAVGGYNVTVSKTGFKTTTIPVSIADHDVSRTVALAKITAEHKLFLTVQGQRGELRPPLPGANVSVMGAGGGTAASGVTDSAGRCSVSLPDGAYTAVVSKADYRTANLRIMISNEDVNRVVVLASTSTPPSTKAALHLTIMERTPTAMRPVPGADITIMQNQMPRASGHSDAGGHYTATLLPGSYSVQVASKGYQSAHAEVTLAGHDVSQTIALTRVKDGSGTTTRVPVNLHVTWRDPRKGMVNVAGAMVVISQNQRPILQGMSGGDGMYHTTLLAGTYQVAVSKAGFATVQLTLTVDNQPITREVTLQSTIR